MDSDTILIPGFSFVAGPPEGTLEDQWKQLDKAMELGILEFAPDDEIIGETLSCQSELLQQMTANRLATANLLKKVMEQLPELKEEWKAKDALADEILGAFEVRSLCALGSTGERTGQQQLQF